MKLPLGLEAKHIVDIVIIQCLSFEPVMCKFYKMQKHLIINIDNACVLRFFFNSRKRIFYQLSLYI